MDDEDEGTIPGLLEGSSLLNRYILDDIVSECWFEPTLVNSSTTRGSGPDTSENS